MLIMFMWHVMETLNVNSRVNQLFFFFLRAAVSAVVALPSSQHSGVLVTAVLEIKYVGLCMYVCMYVCINKKYFRL